MTFENLFTPLRLGRREVKNRIAFVATVSNFGVDNRVSDRLIQFSEARAAGGAGLIVTEGLVVHPTSVPQPAVVNLSLKDQREALARWAEAVERHDCRLLGQLWHVGRQQLWSPIASPWGVSEQPDALSWTVPHVMTPAEIEAVGAAFVAAAKQLQAAGFSGAELHGAHGYLITQFLSPWSNTREDTYGGDVEGRTRFLREIIAGIRAECGARFILGLKMPADEGVPGGIDLDEARRITARLLKAGGLDYIAYSQGNFSLSLERHVPDLHWPQGPFVDLGGTLRREVVAPSAPAVAVMAVGRITDAAHGEHLLAEGAADLIGLSRALVADAALPRKAQQPVADAALPRKAQQLDNRTAELSGDLPSDLPGAAETAGVPRAGEMTGAGGGTQVGASASALPGMPEQPHDPTRPCTFCNVCWGEIHAGRPLACFLNTRVGSAEEVSEASEFTAGQVRIAGRRRGTVTPRRIVVVGAGLAGLAAAAAAAERGHCVNLLGSSSRPGGKARLEALLPGRAATQLAIDYLVERCRLAGVHNILGPTADVAAIRGLAPQRIILATGSHLHPPTLEADSDPFIDLRKAVPELVAEPAQTAPVSGAAVLFDQDHTAPVYAAAELLAQRYERVVLLTPRVQLAQEVPYVSRIGAYRRLYEARVELVPAAVPVSLQAGALIYRNPFSGQLAKISEVAQAFYVTPRQVEDRLARELAHTALDGSPSIQIIGDAYAPRTPLAAVHEGAQAGGEI